MEFETLVKTPLLGKDLESPVIFEADMPLYMNFATSSRFGLDLLFCSCLGYRNKLSKKEAGAFLKLHSSCKPLISLQNNQHRRSLLGIWLAIFTEDPPKEPTLNSQQWKIMGFQNENPESDFRSGGVLALNNLLCFVEQNQDLIKEMNDEKNEFLLAISSINVSFFLKKYFLMAEEADYRNGKEVCSKVIFKGFCKWAAKDDEVLIKLHELILKYLFFDWLLKKKNDPTLNIMSFNKVFGEVKSGFNKKMRKMSGKEMEFVEKVYEEKIEKLKNKLK